MCTVEGFLLPRGKTSERERWLSEMVRGGWSQARKRCCREGDVLLLGGGGCDELTTLRGWALPCCWVVRVAVYRRVRRGGVMRCERYGCG